MVITAKTTKQKHLSLDHNLRKELSILLAPLSFNEDLKYAGVTAHTAEY